MLRVRDRLHDKQPRWFAHVVATGIGPKISDGSPTNELALHFVVPKKVRRDRLSRAQRIPKTIAGFATDVVRGTGEISAVHPPVPGKVDALACGADLGSSLKDGTLGAVALTKDGDPVLLTARHVISNGEIAYFGVVDPAHEAGTCVADVNTRDGEDVYGEFAIRPDEIFFLDAASVRLRAGRRAVGGLPDGKPFVREDPLRVAKWLLDGAPMLALGAASGWRHGRAIQLFPRRVTQPQTGYCLVQETSDVRSEEGDSGSLWLAYRDQQYFVAGMHHGWLSRDAQTYTFVTDICSALQFLGIDKLLGDPEAVEG